MAWAIVVSVLLNLVFVMRRFVGAAVMTVLFMVNVISYGSSCRNSWGSISFSRNQLCVLPSIGMALMLYGIRSIVAIDSFSRLFIAISLGASIYGLLVFFLSSALRENPYWTTILESLLEICIVSCTYPTIQSEITSCTDYGLLPADSGWLLLSSLRDNFRQLFSYHRSSSSPTVRISSER